MSETATVDSWAFETDPRKYHTQDVVGVNKKTTSSSLTHELLGYKSKIGHSRREYAVIIFGFVVHRSEPLQMGKNHLMRLPLTHMSFRFCASTGAHPNQIPGPSKASPLAKGLGKTYFFQRTATAHWAENSAVLVYDALFQFKKPIVPSGGLRNF
jgi:hypothetical protein